MKMKLRCLDCGLTYPLSINSYQCKCGGAMEVVHDLEGLKKKNLREIFDRRLVDRKAISSSGVWRYRELVMDIDDESIVTRCEGNTNLYRSKHISKYTGVRNLFLKHEGENPTGSFKDRGMTVAMTMARAAAKKRVACASTGNTSASMASYAAHCGIRSFVFIPRGKIALGKLAQAIAFGATCLQLDSDFDAAMDLVQELAVSRGVYLLNSVNPFRIEGQKTILFEALQQLDWEVPDWLVLPGGNLGNSSAMGKALMELKELGIIDKIPRIAVIQAKGANPLYLYYSSNYQRYHPVAAETYATAIRIGNPVNLSKCERALRFTSGVVEQLEEEEIVEAKSIVDSSGIGAEPASCCTVGGVKKLVERRIIGKDETVMGILTGHLLKDPQAILDYNKGKIIEGFTTTDPANDFLKKLF